MQLPSPAAASRLAILALALLVAGCTLPRSGPTANEIRAGAGLAENGVAISHVDKC